MPGSIAFVCPELLPMLLESTAAPYREAAVQSLHLAEELHRRGWQLAFVTPVDGVAAEGVIPSRLGPIHVLAASSATDVWWTRWRRARRLAGVLQRLAPDVVVGCGASRTGGARLRPSASPARVQLLTGERPSETPHAGHVRGATDRARLLLVPSRDFRSRLGRAAKRACVLPPAFPLPPEPRRARRNVAWVGPLDRESGADVLLDLADALPEQRFDVCTQAGPEPRYARRFRQRATACDNVVVHANASYQDVVAHLAHARLLVSTARRSDLAARTVLAMLHGAVVVSLASDADALLRRRRVGLWARDPQELYVAVREALDGDGLCDELRQRARAYAEEHFDVRRVAGDCEDFLRTLIGA